MVASVAINPMATTNAGGLFSVTTDGLVQGAVMDDPVARQYLATGYVDPSETLPMWPGIAITESISAGASAINGTLDRAYGPPLTRASTVAGIAGFTTLNQFHAGIVTPQSRAPTAGTYQTVPFFRIGSGARMALPCQPSLQTLLGGLTTQQVSWDFNDQIIAPYDAATATYSLTSITSSYAAGVYTMVVVAAVPTLVGGIGDVINVGGVTGTGASLANGPHVVTAFTDNQHFTYTVNAASGAIATGALAGAKVLNEGFGALGLRIIDANFGNSRTSQWDAINLVANYNETGSALLVIL